MSIENSTSWKTYITAALISAVIGFAAVYVIVGGREASQSETADQQADKSVAATEGSFSAASSIKLNVGKMTSFVFEDKPEALPDVKFNDAAGNQLSLKSFTGKTVLLNLWATWCAPCLQEMPHLDELQARLGSGKFEVVAVSLDRGNPAKPKKFLDDIQAKALRFYHDPLAKLNFDLDVIGMPTTLLIDGEGREIGRLVGPAEWHSGDAVRLIKAHLPKTDS